ncbi:MAG: hypothetical protein M3Q45_00080, partial [Chloroflexota bacterium]|nr:hypothetical protein [Chloroflexota bacterium]
MEIEETTIHSFVIRLWLEEAATATDPTRWRGHITHIPSNQRQHIDTLDAIQPMIAAYLHYSHTA